MTSRAIAIAWDVFLSGVERDALEDLLYMAKQDPQPVEGMIFWSMARLARHQLDSQFIKIDLRAKQALLSKVVAKIEMGREGARLSYTFPLGE